MDLLWAQPVHRAARLQITQIYPASRRVATATPARRPTQGAGRRGGASTHRRPHDRSNPAADAWCRRRRGEGPGHSVPALFSLRQHQPHAHLLQRLRQSGDLRSRLGELRIRTALTHPRTRRRPTHPTRPASRHLAASRSSSDPPPHDRPPRPSRTRHATTRSRPHTSAKARETACVDGLPHWLQNVPAGHRGPPSWWTRKPCRCGLIKTRICVIRLGRKPGPRVGAGRGRVVRARSSGPGRVAAP